VVQAAARRAAFVELARHAEEIGDAHGDTFFRLLVVQVCALLKVDCAFVAETVPGDARRARTVAVCVHGRIADNVEYPLAGTPCAEIVDGRAVCYAPAARRQFPHDPLLVEFELGCYLGVPLPRAPGGRAGWLAVMHRAPLADPALGEAVLRLCAGRATAELGRRCTEETRGRARAALEEQAWARAAALEAANEALQREIAEHASIEAALRQSEEKFAKAFRSSLHWMAITSLADGRFLEVNESFLRSLGYTRDEVVGRSVVELGLWVRPEDRDRMVAQLRSDGALRDFTLDYRTKAGEQRSALLSAELIEVGGQKCVLAVVHDVTEHRRAEAALRESEERYALAAQGANDGVWDWDLRTGAVYYSPRWKAILGCEEAEIGSSPDEWLSRVHPDDRPRLDADLAAHREGRTAHFQNEHRVRHKRGGHRWVLVRGLAVRDAAGEAYRMAGSLTDITERRLAEERLLRDALRDALTGLPNRALFMDRVGRALERARRHPRHRFAVLFLDLDRFKVVNDGLGHAAGDELLVAIARTLETCLRPGDTVARLGGDEFTILLEDIKGVANATRVADRIQEALASAIALGGQEVFTSASIGIAVSARNYGRAEELLRDADTAMYRAKAQGRARYEVFDVAMHAEAVAQLRLETELRRAIERHEFRVHYQPILDLDGDQVAGFEALVRWQHPTRGLLTPAEFLSVAEDTGLIVPIGRSVLWQACRQMRAWQRHNRGAADWMIAVNLCSRQFIQPGLVEEIRAVLRDTRLDPRSLVLEITEGVLMDNADAVTAVLEQLRVLGIRLSLDDFGTGYSSLSALHRFPIDFLKIDRSFVRRIGATGDNGEVVRTIVTLAHNLAKDVIAEGVETPEQLAELRGLACDYVQGFYFGRTVDAAAAEALIAHHRAAKVVPRARRTRRRGSP
jgi:diguanylate cyclase (GGDEF)-like protein/PAS domain S-box-containing protein